MKRILFTLSIFFLFSCNNGKKEMQEAKIAELDNLIANQKAKNDLVEAYANAESISWKQAEFLYDTLWKYPNIQPKKGTKEYKALIKFIKKHK